jgi:hypothetical protein
MGERMKFSLSTVWLILSIATLLAPVFIPSGPGRNVIGYATATMMLLSFPSSLFVAPLMIFVNFSIGFNTIAFEGQYLNLIFLFAVGCLQWFWIAPRISGENAKLQALGLEVSSRGPALPRPIPRIFFRPFDTDGRTPVERVIEEDHRLRQTM